MDFNTLKNTAREKFDGACRVCPICDGKACPGQIPGMGGVGTGTTFHNNIRALAAFRLNLSTVHNVEQPKLNCRILGLDLSMPIMGAAIGGININMKNAMSEEEYALAVVTGCAKAGAICMTGDGVTPSIFESGLKAVTANNGHGIPIIKPRDTDKIIEWANNAEKAGAKGFGIDIDAAGLLNMVNAGQKVGPKTSKDLAKIKQETSIPFIVKGIMTVRDAEACAEAGVDSIVVSNHGGRALDHLPGTAEVLHNISVAVKNKMTVLVDGGVRSGTDVLKMLALGADAVLLGRPLAIGAVGNGADGAEFILNKIAGELRIAMILTGTADVADVDYGILC